MRHLEVAFNAARAALPVPPAISCNRTKRHKRRVCVRGRPLRAVMLSAYTSAVTQRCIAKSKCCCTTVVSTHVR